MDSKISLREIKDIITNDLQNKLAENVETNNEVLDFITEQQENDDEPDNGFIYFKVDVWHSNDGTLYDLWDINKFGMPDTDAIGGILYRLCEAVEEASYNLDDVENITVEYKGNTLVLWETPSYQFLIEKLKNM